MVSCTASQAELRLDHAPDADWPFAFEARQVFTLDEAGLLIPDETDEESAGPVREDEVEKFKEFLDSVSPDDFKAT